MSIRPLQKKTKHTHTHTHTHCMCSTFPALCILPQSQDQQRVLFHSFIWRTGAQWACGGRSDARDRVSLSSWRTARPGSLSWAAKQMQMVSTKCMVTRRRALNSSRNGKWCTPASREDVQTCLRTFDARYVVPHPWHMHIGLFSEG